MALKKQYPSLSMFSMSSMTDVIFLLLIFFLVTSTLISPAAIDVNLPQASTQTTLKPVTEVYIDSLGTLSLVIDRNDSIPAHNRPFTVDAERLMAELALIQQTDSLRAVALYADKNVPYGQVVEVLDLAARNNLKMVLSARARE